jgi:glycosyltransferase involved in cell wall biosynthesis
MKRINILHIRDGIGIYGAERVILTLAKHMDKEKFNFMLLCMSHKDGRSKELITRARELGIHVIPINVNGRLDFSAIAKIRRIIKQNKVMVCHAHDYKSVFYTLVAAVNLGVKLVATAHGSTRDSLVKRIYLSITEQYLYKFFDKIIAVSEDIRKQLKKYHVKQHKIDVIQNGIDFSLINAKSRAIDDEYMPISAGRKVFGVIGRLFPDKGHRFFLEAFSIVLKRYSHIMGVIVGDGPGRDEIIRKVREMRLDNHIYVCGEKSDMKAVYNHLDYLVIPSLREGLPYVLLEAMACSIPVLATAVGEIPALIEDGVNGHLVAPGDADALAARMMELLVNTSKSKDMAKKAHSLVEKKYSAEKMAKSTEVLYTKMMS